MANMVYSNNNGSCGDWLWSSCEGGIGNLVEARSGQKWCPNQPKFKYHFTKNVFTHTSLKITEVAYLSLSILISTNVTVITSIEKAHLNISLLQLNKYIKIYIIPTPSVVNITMSFQRALIQIKVPTKR